MNRCVDQYMQHELPDIIAQMRATIKHLFVKNEESRKELIKAIEVSNGAMKKAFLYKSKGKPEADARAEL